MRSKTLLSVAALFLLMASSAQAELTIIGTAEYLGQTCKLIWDDDNNGKSIVWLDYSSENMAGDNSDPDVSGQGKQVDWAAGLNAPYILTYHISTNFQVTWNGDWRLPDVGENPQQGCDGAAMGSDQTTSEMGHLYFTEIGLISRRMYTSYELNYYSGVFENLIAHKYWYQNEFDPDPEYGWGIVMSSGCQNATNDDGWGRGIAVREASITVVSNDPYEPPSIDIPKAINPSSELTTIGTAIYQGAEYKLVWESDNNGHSIIWLDYTKPLDAYADQLSWAAGLNAPGVLTYTIDSEFSVSWEGDWRLPGVGNDPRRGFYGETRSELGHLFHVELGLYFPTHGDGYETYNTSELFAAGEFDHLVHAKYWYADPFDPMSDYFAYNFDMSIGYQNIDRTYPNPVHGYEYENAAIAVRNATVVINPAVDADGDGIVDYRDNCSQTSNHSQFDTDGDGYGNACDCDIDGEAGGDGSVNYTDYQLLRTAYGASGPVAIETVVEEEGEEGVEEVTYRTYGGESENWNADADFNGDNTVNYQDYQIFRSRYGAARPFE